MNAEAKMNRACEQVASFQKERNKNDIFFYIDSEREIAISVTENEGRMLG